MDLLCFRFDTTMRAIRVGSYSMIPVAFVGARVRPHLEDTVYDTATTRSMINNGLKTILIRVVRVDFFSLYMGLRSVPFKNAFFFNIKNRSHRQTRTYRYSVNLLKHHFYAPLIVYYCIL